MPLSPLPPALMRLTCCPAFLPHTAATPSQLPGLSKGLPVMPTGFSHRSAERDADPPPPYRSNTPLPSRKKFAQGKGRRPPQGGRAARAVRGTHRNVRPQKRFFFSGRKRAVARRAIATCALVSQTFALFRLLAVGCQLPLIPELTGLHRELDDTPLLSPVDVVRSRPSDWVHYPHEISRRNLVFHRMDIEGSLTAAPHMCRLTG